MYVLINVKKTIVEWEYYLDTTSLMSVFTYFIFYFCYQCDRCHVVVIETLYKSVFTHYKIHKVTKWQNDYCLPSCDTLCYSNFLPKTHSFSDIRRQKCRDLEIRVRGHSRSSEPTPIYTPPVTSSVKLSRTVSQIIGDFRRKSQMFPTPIYLTPLIKEFPLELGTEARCRKLEWWG